jgi:tetratricopeptide (TPR) repeat protein
MTTSRGILGSTLALALLGAAAAPAQQAPPVGQLVEGMKCATDPSQTYTLYLPRAYDPAKSWPAMLVLDPRGRSVVAAELFREAAERRGWILLSSNDTRSDGPWEPNEKALSALWPEVRQRYSTDPKRLYAAGFSGTVIVAWGLGLGTNGLAGVLSSCGRLEPSSKGKLVTFAQYSATGTTDFNHLPTLDMDAYLEKSAVPHRLAVFDGPHSWLPKEQGEQAIEWFEALAMKQGRREKDPALAQELYGRELARARAAEEAGDLLAAVESYRSLETTFKGLVAVEEASKQAAVLAASKAFQDAERDAEAARHYEESQTAIAWRALGAWQASEPPQQPASALAVQMGIPGLRKQSVQDGPRGDAAERVLASIASQTGFYLSRDLLAQRRFGEAATLIEVATLAHPGNPTTLYNLACAQALAGDRKKALGSLRKSVEAGFTDGKHMQEDTDLVSLREMKEFQEMVAKLGG